MLEALEIQVKGVVQGVGFRPFIYRLAKRYLINGWVLNALAGVLIHAEGESKLLDEFVLEISANPPSASKVEEIEMREVPIEGFEGFEIRFSEPGAAEKTTLISPDLATCDDCVRELFDKGDRRFRYPFINCTNCGPRFTIIDGLPYDRKSTSMRAFPMCPSCEREYGDPQDRRFHAQPDACFACGPHISWRLAGGAAEGKRVEWGSTREESDAIFSKAVAFLHTGKILAVKGLGGFHLVCDAANTQALRELRARKRREGQAFAVMVEDLAMARRYCALSEAEEELLSGPAHPIVLLKKLAGVRLAEGLADGLSELGVMLPYTPVQHLLIRGFGGMLVMTSGNIHDEPIVTDDEDAYRRLGKVADAFLGHDRAIVARYDDSVLRVLDIGEGKGAIQFVRRARGYAPMPLDLPKALVAGSVGSTGGSDSTDNGRLDTGNVSSGNEGGNKNNGNSSDKESVSLERTAKLPSVFATGPEQKNTFCMTRGEQAFVSQHIGDMENAEAFDAWLAAKKRYGQLFEMAPASVACDLHPEYLTSKWAHGQELAVLEVQHHHAHIASVMAENDLEAPVVGIAFDGTGFGVDGNIWGGEVLICNLVEFERFANFSYVPMPGGAAAVKHPLRMAYGVLWAFDLLGHPAAQKALAALGQQAAVCAQMIERGLNAPLTSSVGRLFDAASALLGICTEARYEGEGAMLLEAAIGDEAGEEAYQVDILKNAATSESTAKDTSVVLFDAAALFSALLDDLAAGVALQKIALRFHNGIAAAIIDVCRMAEMLYGITTVALSGGVFMNRYLTQRCLRLLPLEGFTVAINRELPPNDGCISFGQAVVALATKNS